jgi:hypothetical protein
MELTRSRGLCALVLACAAGTAPAHVIYTTGFEVGQTSPGPLRGQDLWSDAPLNLFHVSNANPGEESQSIVFAPGASALALAHRTTDQIAMHGWPGMTDLMFSAMVRIDNAREGSTFDLNIRVVDEVPGGAMNIGIQDGRAYVSSSLHDAPFLLGPQLEAGRWTEIMLVLNMLTGDFMGMVDGTPFGMFHVPIEMLELDASSGVTMSASIHMDSPGAESVQIDALRVMHMMPSPGAAALLGLGLLRVGASRRRA